MTQTVKLTAFLIANQLDIKGIKSFLDIKPIADLAREDECLYRLHQGLMKHFDLRVRFSEIEYTLRIIEDNLIVFKEIIHQRESNILEYIIIILIIVEVFDLLFTKLFNY